MAYRRRPRKKWQSVPHTHPAFRPYAEALGQIALAWNEFHETMSLLFCSFMGGGYCNHYLAVWQALKNDRAKRDVLLAAAKNSPLFNDEESRKRIIEAAEHIYKLANTVEDARDSALHSPLWGARYESGIKVQPETGLGHIRAGRLRDQKNLLAEFRWCRAAASVLADYVDDLNDSLSGRSRRPWPKKPSLPNRGETNEKKPRHQAPQAKH
jgi:hypothetical protein